MDNPFRPSTYLKLWAVLVCTMLLGCRSNDHSLELNIYNRFRTQHLEARDSLFIFHMVKELTKLNWYTFSDYSLAYRIENDQVDHFIGGTFYSPDRTKIITWIGAGMPNAKSIETYSEDPEANRLCPDGSDTVYNMTALIGFRDGPNAIWHLYPFNNEQATCCSSKEQAINILGQYYFERLKTHRMGHIRQGSPKKGEYQLDEYGFNLQDPGFWDQCWLWQKDTVDSCHLYPFQVLGYCRPIEVPSIVIPREILDLYDPLGER